MPANLAAPVSMPAEPRIQHRFVIFMLCFFSGWVMLKLLNVQFLEAFMLMHLTYLFCAFLLRGMRGSVYGFWIWPGAWFGAIMAGILAVDLFDLRLPRFALVFAPPLVSNAYLLLFSRYIELFLCVFYGVYAAELMRRDARLRYYGMRIYVISAVVSVFYTVLSYPAYKAGVWWVGMYEGPRGRGGFTEGGPWGLYLLSVCLVARVLFVRGRMKHGFTVLVVICMTIGFLFAQSKACALAAILLFGLSTFLRSSYKQKFASVIIAALVFITVWYALDLPKQFRGALRLRQEAELLVWSDPNNPSTAYGRVAASVIVPRMIGEHWASGIGWGMYPLARNNPQYLGIMKPVKAYDLAGLGLLSEGAELGIPALILLYVMMFYPVYLALKTRAHRLVAMMGLLPPVAFLFGAQFTLFYPWLMLAFSLSWLPLQHGGTRPVRVARPLLPVAHAGGVKVTG